MHQMHAITCDTVAYSKQLHDHDRDDQVRGDDPRRESVRDDAAAEPAFETDQQKRGDGRPQDSRITAMMTPRRDRRSRESGSRR